MAQSPWVWMDLLISLLEDIDISNAIVSLWSKGLCTDFSSSFSCFREGEFGCWGSFWMGPLWVREETLSCISSSFANLWVPEVIGYWVRVKNKLQCWPFWGGVRVCSPSLVHVVHCNQDRILLHCNYLELLNLQVVRALSLTEQSLLMSPEQIHKWVAVTTMGNTMGTHTGFSLRKTELSGT